MKLSVVIPHHNGVLGADKLLRDCLHSLRGHDEVIVYSNDGEGYGPAVNRALELVTSNHIIVCNNDVRLQEGNLKDLIVNNKITIPKIIPPPKDNEPRAVFCMPRYIYDNIIDRYGYFYDERFEMGYWEDDDLIKRLEEMEIPTQYIDTVRFEHFRGGGNSMKQMGEQYYHDLNKGKFDEKWGG